MKQNTCCFTGHRPNKLPFGCDEACMDCVRLRIRLAVEIEEMRQKGVTTFLTGMAQGVDIWGAEIVLDLKRAYADKPIYLVAVIPYKGQADRWTRTYRDRYDHILAAADDMVMLRPHYATGCLYERSRYMVDNAGHMIAVFDGKPGETKYTVDCARKKGLDVVIINPCDWTKKV